MGIEASHVPSMSGGSNWATSERATQPLPSQGHPKGGRNQKWRTRYHSVPVLRNLVEKVVEGIPSAAALSRGCPALPCMCSFRGERQHAEDAPDPCPQSQTHLPCLPAPLLQLSTRLTRVLAMRKMACVPLPGSAQEYHKRSPHCNPAAWCRAWLCLLLPRAVNTTMNPHPVFRSLCLALFALLPVLGPLV